MGMGQSSSWIAALLILLCSEVGFGEAYKNYTVADSLGWYDNLMKPDADYQKWAADKSFSLGDFLIFNTDNNHSVVQTYSLSTYKSCDYTGEDSTEWSTSKPSNTDVYPVTVAVPLLKEGVTYFFSGDYDGWQCQHGQQFQINVTHGQGLPPSLKPSAESPSESESLAPAPAEFGDSAPDTVIPENFNHPKNGQSGGGGSDDGGDGGDGEDSKASASGCGSVFVGGRWVLLGRMGLLLVAAGCLF